MSCAILLPAAGASSRMRGGDKLLEQVAGAPVLSVMARRAISVSPHVAVTLRPADDARRTALAALPVTVLEVPDAAEGMAASLRIGAGWAIALQVSAMMIALPDMPDITADDMRALIEKHSENPQSALRAATASGAAGHPTILPAQLFPAMTALHGDTGARDLLRADPPRLHRLSGLRAVTDLDTPEAWAAWRGQSA